MSNFKKTQPHLFVTLPNLGFNVTYWCYDPLCSPIQIEETYKLIGKPHPFSVSWI